MTVLYKPETGLTSEANHIITLGKGRRVSELCSQEAERSHARSHVSRVVLAFWREKAHGIPFEAILLSPSHVGGERKRKSCGTTSGEKVPTHRFLAKKEGVWHKLSRTGANSRIFGEKGSHVA